MSEEIVKKGKAELVYFSSARIALTSEIRRHPQLLELIHQAGCGSSEADWIRIVEKTATYVFVLLDGVYLPMELEKIYERLYFKLQSHRALIVN